MGTRLGIHMQRDQQECVMFAVHIILNLKDKKIHMNDVVHCMGQCLYIQQDSARAASGQSPISMALIGLYQSGKAGNAVYIFTLLDDHIKWVKVVPPECNIPELL